MSTEGAGAGTAVAPARRLLLHICCGPCAVAPLAALRDEGWDVVGLWFNPNIHPSAEYLRRLDSCRQFAAVENLPLLEAGDYGLTEFLRRVLPADEGIGPGARCLECYRWRLAEAAAQSAEFGFAGFSTTLLVSPYQQHEAIAAVGRAAAEDAGVQFVYRDWRPLFREARGRSRALGLYHQDYCGCLLSEAERYGERKARARVAKKPGS